MEEIKRQVARARRRLVMQQFLQIFAWSMFAVLLVAVIGVAIPKIWHLPILQAENGWTMWAASWIGGAAAVGVLTACVWTYIVRRDSLEAALELDRRFGLKERVSSALALLPEERESEIGRALMDDTARRVANVDVRERFAVTPSWKVAMPLLPALIVTGLLFLPNRPAEKQLGAGETPLSVKKRIIEQNEELKKQIAAKRKELEGKDLKDAEAALREMEEKLEKIITDENLHRNKALVKLNDLKKDLDEKRQKLAGSEKLQQQLNQLKPAERGPADKIAAAMQNGDFKKAMEEIKKLQEKMNNGELDPAAKEQLEKQMKEMADKMEQMAGNHEAAKKQLEQQIAAAQQAGNQQLQQQLQQQLEEMKMADPQMQKLAEMAQNLAQAQQAMQQGDMQQANQQLDQLAQQLQEMKDQLDQMQMLDEAMDQIAQCKNGICQGENGMDPELGQFGMGQGQGQGDKPGNGLGQGQGQGARPEEETDTNFFESQVRGKVRPGEAVRTGDAGGPNIAGLSQEEAKEVLVKSIAAQAEAIDERNYSRSQRDQAREYFQSLRDGE